MIKVKDYIHLYIISGVVAIIIIIVIVVLALSGGDTESGTKSSDSKGNTTARSTTTLEKAILGHWKATEPSGGTAELYVGSNTIEVYYYFPSIKSNESGEYTYRVYNVDEKNGLLIVTIEGEHTKKSPMTGTQTANESSTMVFSFTSKDRNAFTGDRGFQYHYVDSKQKS